MDRDQYNESHDLFRASVRQFVEREMVPHYEEWDAAGIVDKSLFRKAGEAGFLGIAAPERWGGGGESDFRYNAIFTEEICRAGVFTAGLGIALHNDVCLPYFLEVADDEQRDRWLPGICSGELVAAIAMTEPGGGSDVASIRTVARRSLDGYVLDGAKTFISNGINSDHVIVACKTDPHQGHRGISLIVVEAGMPGFERGRNLDKIGQHAADTAELFFNDVQVPVSNRLGIEGEGRRYLMRGLPQERLSIALNAVALARQAFDWTIEYVQGRSAFGQPIGAFQNTRFVLAELRTEMEIAQVYVDRQVRALSQGELTAVDAAQAKWWCTELCSRVLDRCLQLHGGYGYMSEYPIGRAWRDARVMTIYGGTTEIMKEIIGRDLGL
jgi:alkylation response protein AidB-like acyl-CoA dehydrogenase